jgi:hypothetical protein
VTEAEWLACTDPRRMWAFLQETTSLRKARLLFAACCDRLRHAPSEQGTRRTEEVGGRHPEEAVHADAPSPITLADDAARFYLLLAATEALNNLGAGNSEQAAQVALLHDLFGNPFRHVHANAAWLIPTITALAQAAYYNRALPAGTLEPARLAVLADALEEAGCTDQAILDHLRSPGPHVRGCWAVDLLLGKE